MEQRINAYGRNIQIHGVNLSVGYEFQPEWFACGQSPLCVEVDLLVRSGVVVVFNDAAYGAELHQYAVRGLDEEAMLIEEVDFAAVGRAFGAEGVKARSLADLDALKDWVARGAEGVFVLDLPISRNVVAEYMAESMAGAQPAPRPLPVD